MGFLDRIFNRDVGTTSAEVERLDWRATDRPKDRFLMELAGAFKEGTTKKGKTMQIFRRITRERLFKIYSMDDTTFRCVNFYAQQVVGPDFAFIGDNEKAKELCEEFKTVTDMTTKLEDVVRDMCIGGNGWLELMETGNGDLGNIAYLDFRYMDYQRSPEKYVLEIPGKDSPVGYRFKAWDGTITDFSPDTIAHFKLFGEGNELAYGYVEPLYRTIFNKLNVVAGLSQGGWRVGYPLTVGYVGDAPDGRGYQGHKVTQGNIDQMSDVLEDIEHKHKIILPFYTKIDQLKSEKIEFQTLLDYFDQRIAGAFGIYGDLVGVTAKSNKAAVEIMAVRDLDRSIRSKQNKLSLVLKRDIFTRLCLENGFKEEDVPDIKWINKTPPDLNRAAKRRQAYIETGILSPKEVRDAVLKEEEIIAGPEPPKPPEPQFPQPGMPPKPGIKPSKGKSPEDPKIGNLEQDMKNLKASMKTLKESTKLEKEVIDLEPIKTETKLYTDEKNKEIVSVLNEGFGKITKKLTKYDKNLEKLTKEMVKIDKLEEKAVKIDEISEKVDKIEELGKKIDKLDKKQAKFVDKKTLETFKEEILKEKTELGSIVRAVTEGSISPEEAILALRRIKTSFPSGMGSKLVDELIKQIMLATTGIEVPTETGGIDVVQGE